MSNNPPLTLPQLELLNSFRYLTDDSQISEVKELLNLYYRRKLEDAIDEAVHRQGFTAEVYAEWLSKKQ